MPERKDFLTGWIEGKFRSFDGAELFYRFFEPSKPRHTLLILHGYGEHSGRYLKFPEKLKLDSVRIAIMDLRGMGHSGLNALEPASLEEFLQDLDRFAGHLRAVHGVRDRLILMGHSMGGLLAIDWVMTRPDRVKRLVLSAPFLGLVGLPFLRVANVAVKFFLPGHVYHNPVMPKTLSHDEKEVELYRNDPLIKRSISARMIGSIMAHIIRLRKRETVTLPFAVHFLAAGKEKVVDPKVTKELFDRLVAPKKEWVEFEGFYHEIFNETGQDRVFNVLRTILEECV